MFNHWIMSVTMIKMNQGWVSAYCLYVCRMLCHHCNPLGKYKQKVITKTTWLVLTDQRQFDFFCLHLKNNTVHLMWHGVRTNLLRQNFEIQSPNMYSRSGSSSHLLCKWTTCDWLWGWPTSKYQHWKWLVHRMPL